MLSTMMSLAKLGSIVSTYALILLYSSASALRIVVINVPAIADTRQLTRLFCSYDTGQEALFSVKWYYDEREFFRYMPTHEPNFLIFPLPGFAIQEPDHDQCDTHRCGISLALQSINASGTYSCEVSTEAPTFRTVMETKNVTVMTLPKEKPRIEGMRSTYDVGEVLDIKCRSSPSFPPATLTLYVNDLEIDGSFIDSVIQMSDDEFTSSARLRVVLAREHFLGALLRVKCTGVLSSIAATALSAELTATLAAPRTLHIQKLEWPSAAGQKSISSHLLVFFIIVYLINYKIYR